MTVLINDISNGSSLGGHLLLLFSCSLPHLGKLLVESDLLLQQVVGVLLGLFLLGNLLLHCIGLFSNRLGLELN
jgi:hypothetical protein